MPALILTAGGYLALRFPSQRTLASLAAVGIITIVAVAWPVARTWTVTRYDDAVKESFSEWRARIPPGSEVLWVDTEPERAAPSTWFLLERASYMSVTQVPNALFSRAAALEMSKRAEALRGLLPFWSPFRPRHTQSKPKGQLLLEPICRNLEVVYVVTNETLADATPIPAPASVSPDLRGHKLYICT